MPAEGPKPIVGRFRAISPRHLLIFQFPAGIGCGEVRSSGTAPLARDPSSAVEVISRYAIRAGISSSRPVCAHLAHILPWVMFLSACSSSPHPASAVVDGHMDPSYRAVQLLLGLTCHRPASWRYRRLARHLIRPRPIRNLAPPCPPTARITPAAGRGGVARQRRSAVHPQSATRSPAGTARAPHRRARPGKPERREVERGTPAGDPAAPGHASETGGPPSSPAITPAAR